MVKLKSYKFSMNDLKTKFKLTTIRLVLSVGGQWRAGFYPATEEPMDYGGCPVQCGKEFVLKDVLNMIKLKPSANTLPIMDTTYIF